MRRSTFVRSAAVDVGRCREWTTTAAVVVHVSVQLMSDRLVRSAGSALLFCLCMQNYKLYSWQRSMVYILKTIFSNNQILSNGVSEHITSYLSLSVNVNILIRKLRVIFIQSILNTNKKYRNCQRTVKDFFSRNPDVQAPRVLHLLLRTWLPTRPAMVELEQTSRARV